MKKMTKGALAAGVGAALLLGGAGTLAYWSDATSISGGSLETGRLALSDASCDAGWVYAEDNANAGEAVGLLVPGDSIEKRCSFTIDAAGDSLTAELTTPTSTTVTVGGETAPQTLQMPVGATYSIEGEAVPSVITSDNDGDTVTAVLTVSFPFGDQSINGNDTQDIEAALDDIAVQLVQTES